MCEYAFMRTTLEIPDSLFKKAKLKAVHEGLALKDIINRALERDLAPAAEDATARRARTERLLAALAGRNTEPIAPLTREGIHARGRHLPSA